MGKSETKMKIEDLHRGKNGAFFQGSWGK